jgi:hypothetical protein
MERVLFVQRVENDDSCTSSIQPFNNRNTVPSACFANRWIRNFAYLIDFDHCQKLQKFFLFLMFRIWCLEFKSHEPFPISTMRTPRGIETHWQENHFEQRWKMEDAAKLPRTAISVMQQQYGKVYFRSILELTEYYLHCGNRCAWHRPHVPKEKCYVTVIEY